MRIVVLDGFTIDRGEAGWWRALERLGEVQVHARSRREEVEERCEGAEAVITNKVSLYAPLMGPELRYIGVTATGVNIVDLEAARRLGIAVTNVPGYAADSVAQHVFALLLHLTHDVAGHVADVKAGQWAASPDFTFQRRSLIELAGKTLAVLGTGAIGSATGRIGAAFGMQVLAAKVPGSASAGRLPLAEALPRADVVSLHCPLTEKTRGLVDAGFLGLMKPGAILINTSRGQLIKEDDVLAALARGSLGGLGLDVLAQEPPPPGHPLLDAAAPWAARVAVTPHLGWATVEARRRLVEKTVENLQAFLQGRALNRLA